MKMPRNGFVEDFDNFLHAILMTHPGLDFLLETQVASKACSETELRSFKTDTPTRRGSKRPMSCFLWIIGRGHQPHLLHLCLFAGNTCEMCYDLGSKDRKGAGRIHLQSRPPKRTAA